MDFSSSWTNYLHLPKRADTFVRPPASIVVAGLPAFNETCFFKSFKNFSFNSFLSLLLDHISHVVPANVGNMEEDVASGIPSRNKYRTVFLSTLTTYFRYKMMNVAF